ncbi:MAG: ATP-binding cassette domain-containing protein [Schwartzia sp.]|nr:ATP-binding cassette domain-containing protein [Schwartzia sp. (in: firmicutes)]
MSLLEFKHVAFSVADKNILSDISVSAEAGDFISVVGPSGSGKSTFLKLCSDLISPTKGEIFYDGKNFMDYSPVELRKEIGYCFQIPHLFGSTVMDNIKFPYAIRKKKPDMERIKSLFDQFRMSDDYLNRDVENLSGGEKQRLSLIRSMLFMPKILLLDEVTSALDVDNTLLVEDIIASVNASGTTILWITHSPEQSRKYANKILTIEEGRVKSFEEVAK